MIYRPATLLDLECYVDYDFQVDGKMVIKTLRNQYYHTQVLLLCILDDQLIRKEKFKHKLPSLLQKVSTLLCQPQCEN